MKFKIECTTTNGGYKYYKVYKKDFWGWWEALNRGNSLRSREAALDIINDTWSVKTKSIEVEYINK